MMYADDDKHEATILNKSFIVSEVQSSQKGDAFKPMDSSESRPENYNHKKLTVRTQELPSSKIGSFSSVEPRLITDISSINVLSRLHTPDRMLQQNSEARRRVDF